MNYCIKISAANAARLKPICEATRYHPARLANTLIEFALEHVRLVPTTTTVYDLKLWAGSAAPSTTNTMQLFPQLSNIYSGINGGNHNVPV